MTSALLENTAPAEVSDFEAAVGSKTAPADVCDIEPGPEPQLKCSTLGCSMLVVVHIVVLMELW